MMKKLLISPLPLGRCRRWGLVHIKVTKHAEDSHPKLKIPSILLSFLSVLTLKTYTELHLQVFKSRRVFHIFLSVIE